MISSTNYKSVEIDIITYKKGKARNMNGDKYNRCKQNQNKCICSICFSKYTKEETTCCKKKPKLCTTCQNNSHTDVKDNHQYYRHEEYGKKSDTNNINGKNIQTSQEDVTQGLTLLNEVLTVFQNKKQLDTKKDNKTIILKDASTETEEIHKPKLSVSRVFYYSIEEESKNNNCKYTIINCQPETKSQFSIDLIKHKSSSIPQMKMDELKNSLKQKTTSKDAIEEVNRMFATVRKLDSNDSNRPMIRNGPRILPVVKTETNNSDHKLAVNNKVATLNCNYTNYKMSSGDSIQCCHKNNESYHNMCYIKHCSNYCANCQRKLEHN